MLKKWSWELLWTLLLLWLEVRKFVWGLLFSEVQRREGGSRLAVEGLEERCTPAAYWHDFTKDHQWYNPKNWLIDGFAPETSLPTAADNVYMKEGPCVAKARPSVRSLTIDLFTESLTLQS